MTALKARDVPGFLNKPDLKSGIILIYGPDAGRVRETTDQLQKHFQGKDADPMNLISLQFADLDNPDATIETEANTSSMFGGQRIVRVRGATNAVAPTLERLAAEDVPSILLVEAGNLTPKDNLRKVMEKAKSARALPCFADDARSLDQLMREMFRDNQVQIDNDALQALKDQLGNDRQITRSEVEKLILYAANSKKVTLEDVMTLCGDNAMLALDEIIDSAGTGHVQKLDQALARAFDSGIHSSAILTRSLMHFTWLRTQRAKMEEGTSLDQLVNSARPPIHFSRKAKVQTQIRTWSSGNLATACTRIYDAIAQTRKNAALDIAHTRQALLAIATIAARH